VFYVIPVVGYLLLFSNYVQDFFDAHVNVGHLWSLTWRQNALLIYYGSIVLLFSYVIYLWRCPRALRQGDTRQSYVSKTVVALDANEVAAACFSIMLHFAGMNLDELANKYTEHPDKIGELKALRHTAGEHTTKPIKREDFNDWVPKTLMFYYNTQNYSRPLTRTMIGCILTIGYGMVSIPSVGVFFRILSASF
jgi:hypothetical protein